MVFAIEAACPYSRFLDVWLSMIAVLIFVAVGYAFHVHIRSDGELSTECFQHRGELSRLRHEHWMKVRQLKIEVREKESEILLLVAEVREKMNSEGGKWFWRN